MKRLDEFMFMLMVFLFAMGWNADWPVSYIIALVLCVVFVLVRLAWPKIRKYLDRKNGKNDSGEE